MIITNIKIIGELKTFIRAIKEKKIFFSCEKDFSKDRKLPFERTVYLLMNMLKKSLSIELNEFFETIEQPDKCCSKSAFSQQRQKLDYQFFAWWNVILVNSFYHHYKSKIKRWKGYRLVAVDGSTQYLINQPEVLDYFGTQANQSVSVVMGRIVSAYDVLNEITISSQLHPITYSEQQVAQSWIPYYESDMLFLYDRGYPGFATIYLHVHQEKEIKFVIRCKENFNKEVTAFVKSKTSSKIIAIKPTCKAVKELKKHGFIITPETVIKVRLVKVKLDNGTTEILMTNLYHEQRYPLAIFKELYFKRWAVETNYNIQKNILQLESFSGHKVNTILQDFYASIFIGNLQSIISKQCDKKITDNTSHRKYRYKINRNVAIGLMKNRVVKLFIIKEIKELLLELEKLFLRHLEPIRPNRKYQRVTKHKRSKGKYQTWTNYKRAI